MNLRDNILLVVGAATLAVTINNVLWYFVL